MKDMKPLNRRKALIIVMVNLFWILCVGQTNAQSDYEFYLFGQNLKSFRGSNLYEVALGAVASVIAHELGHALYLELSGKTWEFQTSFPLGLAVSTKSSLDNTALQNFGRAGFVSQTLIGLALSKFEKTRHSDFTKGWVAMNAAQVFTYPLRRDETDNDLKIIDKGGGNGNLEFAFVSFFSLENLTRLEHDFLISLTKSNVTPDTELPYNLNGFQGDTRDVSLSDENPPLQMVLRPEIKAHNSKIFFTVIDPFELNSDFLITGINKFGDYKRSGTKFSKYFAN